MAKVRGTSSAPMTIGLIGGILGLPAAICSGACAVGLSSLSDSSTAAANQAGNAFLAIGLIGSIIAIVFACLTKKSPALAGAMLLVGMVLNAVTMVTFNFLTLVVVILLLIAGILSFTQKKETIK